jgi:hypothetical protein
VSVCHVSVCQQGLPTTLYKYLNEEATVRKEKRCPSLLESHFMLKVSSFYQDRLGTNMGKAFKTQKERVAF